MRLAGAKRKLQIIKVAAGLFARHGFERTTTKMIAQKADINEALLYKHFGSKQEILDSIEERIRTTSQLRMESLVAQSRSWPRLVQGIWFLVEAFIEPPRNEFDKDLDFRFFLRSLDSDGRLAEKIISRNIEPHLSALCEAYLESAAKGYIVDQPDEETFYRRFWYSYSTCISMAFFRLPRKKLMPTHYSDALSILEFLLRGLGVKERYVQRAINTVQNLQNGSRSSDLGPNGVNT